MILDLYIWVTPYDRPTIYKFKSDYDIGYDIIARN